MSQIELFDHLLRIIIISYLKPYSQAAIVSILLYGCTTWTHKNAARNIEQVLEATPDKAAAIQPPTTHHENYPS